MVSFRPSKLSLFIQSEDVNAWIEMKDYIFLVYVNVWKEMKDLYIPHLLPGTLGYQGTSSFVRKIYSTVKID